MKTSWLRCLVAAMIAAFTFGFSPRAEAAELFVDFTISGYAGTSTLANFPVLVKISPELVAGFDYAACPQNTIRFTDASGNPLNFDIDTWNTSGISYVWVSVPSVAGTTTKFRMYYGGAAQEAESGSQDVWTSAGYKSVWHMDIGDGGTTDRVASYAGTVLNPSDYCGGRTGIVGGDYYCEDTVDNKHCVKTTAVDGFNSNICTFSAWVRQVGGTCQSGYPDPTTYPKIKWHNKYGNCGAIWNTRDGATGAGIGQEFCLKGMASSYATMILNDSLGGSANLSNPTSIYDKAWHYMVLRYDGKQRTVWVDGNIQPNFTRTITYTPKTTGTIRMGGRNDETTECIWTGDLDEMRFRAEASTEDWLDAEYANVKTDTFVTNDGASVTPPVFDPPTSVFYQSITVTLTCETEGATIRYTTDGSDPTGSSTVYEAPIVLTETTTLKAIAEKSGKLASVVVSETYLKSELIPSAPTPVANTTYKVYTNGVESAEGVVWSNFVATVVYTAATGHCFEDGTTASTNRLDTTVNPAVNRTVPVAPFRPEDVLVLGNFNFGSMTFPRVDGLDVGSYKQLTIMLSREMSGETLGLPSIAGYTYNTSLSTDYSYVIDIDAPGKTAAEIAQYIRQVVFNGCRDQHIRVILNAEGTSYRTFYFDENRHYYQYVPFATHNEFPWTLCYKKAEAMTYMGRQGYLATVMSQPEDIFIYKASADPDTGKGRVGWMGGTSCKRGEEEGDLYYASFDVSQPDKSGDGHWYWACGPERGQEFFDWAKQATSCTTAIYTRNAVDNQYYFNWDSLSSASGAQREPNCTSQTGGYERFLTTLGFGYGYNTDPLSKTEGSKLASNVYGWNDLKGNGNIGGKEKWDVLGYVVEFGDQKTGDATEGSYIPGYMMVECDIRAPVITYDATDGAFSSGAKTIAVTQLNAADGYELPGDSPTYAGHYLKGWYMNLEDPNTLVMEGSPLYSRNDHTVYAKWMEDDRKEYTCKTDSGAEVKTNISQDEVDDRGGGNPDAIEENRHRVWENIVMGLDGKGHVATGARQSESETRLNAVAANLDVPPADTGITVTYHLDRVSADGKVRGEEESESDSPNGLSVDLSRIESNEYFKVRIVLSQAESGFVKEFVATNTMGVLKQTQNAESVVLSVPWGALTAGEDAEVAVADLVKTATLTAGDQLRVYRPSSKKYETWQLDANKTWQPVNNVAVGAEGAAKLSVAEGANEATIPRGSGVWLCRKSNTSAPYYLYGQVQTNAATTVLTGGSKTSPTWNLIGSPGVTDLDLNTQFGSGSSGDKIMVPTGYAPKNYTYKNGQWGYNVTVPVYSPTNETQQVGVRMQRKTDDTEVPPGTGFWYINYSDEKNVEWR